MSILSRLNPATPSARLTLVLLVILLVLQFRVWFGEGSLEEVTALKRRIDQQAAEIDQLQARNQQLLNEVQFLKQGTEGVEHMARSELGMIREGETFYMVVDDADEQTE